MTETEKQAKLKVLKSINSSAKQAMSGKLSKKKEDKDSPELKKHVKEMSEDTDIDFKGDIDHITDPELDGNVVGRHITDEDYDDSDLSVYDINDRLEKLIKRKQELKNKYSR